MTRKIYFRKGLTAIYELEYSARMVSTNRKDGGRVKPHSSLAAWRKDMEFTQPEAADYLGISQPYYSKLERKVQQPRRDNLKMLTERTGVPVDVLMDIAG